MGLVRVLGRGHAVLGVLGELADLDLPGADGDAHRVGPPLRSHVPLASGEEPGRQEKDGENCAAA
ncbi:hypothetical protein Lfu02_31720 [Longispora fulva]|nr:hypothetical protein Lfu02_31720 [Longispora fulva]